MVAAVIAGEPPDTLHLRLVSVMRTHQMAGPPIDLPVGRLTRVITTRHYASMVAERLGVSDLAAQRFVARLIASDAASLNGFDIEYRGGQAGPSGRPSIPATPTRAPLRTLTALTTLGEFSVLMPTIVASRCWYSNTRFHPRSTRCFQLLLRPTEATLGRCIFDRPPLPFRSA